MLSVSNLRFDRYFQPVFRPVDFQLERGALLLVTGANGSGKTTLLRLLAGILTSSGGSITISARSLAHVGHLLAIKDDLSVVENLRFARDFLGGGGSGIDAVIDRVGLRRVAGQLARTLSAGQRKRCALARLLVSPAELWLLDEPYSSLDDEGVALLDSMLSEQAEQGGACVLATHGSHRPPIRYHAELRLEAGFSDR